MKHHEHVNSYRITFNWFDLLTDPRFSPLVSWQKSRQHIDRGGAGQGAESSFILTLRQHKESEVLGVT